MSDGKDKIREPAPDSLNEAERERRARREGHDLDGRPLRPEETAPGERGELVVGFGEVRLQRSQRTGGPVNRERHQISLEPVRPVRHQGSEPMRLDERSQNLRPIFAKGRRPVHQCASSGRFAAAPTGSANRSYSSDPVTTTLTLSPGLMP